MTKAVEWDIKQQIKLTNKKQIFAYAKKVAQISCAVTFLLKFKISKSSLLLRQNRLCETWL